MKIYYLSIRRYDGENEVFTMCVDYSTNSKRICKCKFLRFSCSILLYSNKTRNTFSSLIL